MILESAKGPHASLARLNADDQPAPTVAYRCAETGETVRRLTDRHQLRAMFPDAGNQADSETTGLTNCYSRVECVSPDGKYFLAFGTTPWACLYGAALLEPIRVVRSAFTPSRKVGDYEELKWNPGDSYLYYVAGSWLYRQHPETGAEETVLNFAPGRWYDHTSDGSFDNSGRYLAMAIDESGKGRKDGYVVVIDVVDRTVIQTIQYNNPNGVDMSPSGKYVKIDNHYFLRETEAKVGSTQAGHGGWCLDADGRELFVSQWNSCGWIGGYYPDTGEHLYLMRMPGETGGPGVYGMHTASDKQGYFKGKALLSFYGGSSPLADTVLFIELVSQKKPGVIHPSYGGTSTAWEEGDSGRVARIWRGPSMQNKYSGYTTEGFASVGSDRAVYWGGNWNGADNLELYRWEVGQFVETTPTPEPEPPPVEPPPVDPKPKPTKTITVPVTTMVRTFRDKNPASQYCVQHTKLPLWAFVDGDGNGERDQSVIIGTDFPEEIRNGAKRVKSAKLRLWISSNGGRFSRASGKIPIRSILEPWLKPYTGADGRLYGPTWAFSGVKRYEISAVSGKILWGTGTPWSDEPGEGPFSTTGDLSSVLGSKWGAFDLPANGNGAWVDVDFLRTYFVAEDANAYYIDVTNPGAPGVEPGQRTTLCCAVATPTGPESERPHWLIELEDETAPDPEPDPDPPTEPVRRRITVKAGEIIEVEGVA